MHLTVVFVILFKFSFGLHLNLGLAHLFHGLSGGKTELFHTENSKESKSIESDETVKIGTNAGQSGNLKISTNLDSSNLEHSLKVVSEKATEGSNLEDSLKTVAEAASETSYSSNLEDTYENVAEKSGKAINGVILEDSLKTESETAGEASYGSALGYSSESIAENTGKALHISASEDSLETVSEVEDTTLVASALKGSSEAVSEKTGEALQFSASADSVKTVSEEDTALVASALTGSSEAVSEKTGKALQFSASEDSLKTASEKSDEALQGSISVTNLGTIDKKAGKILHGSTSEDTLKTVTLKANKASTSGISDIFHAAGTLKDGIQEAAAANPLKAVIPELLNGETCSSKSTAASFGKVRAISTFVNTFLKGVESSELLTNVFDVTDATPLQFSRFKYRYFADVFRLLGFIDADEIAAFSIRPVAKYFDVLIPHIVTKVYSNFLANCLFAEEILSAENAEKLGLMCIKTMEESAEVNEINYDCDYTRKLKAIGDGITSFILSVGQMTKTKAWELAFYFANAWLLAALDYGSLKDLTL